MTLRDEDIFPAVVVVIEQAACSSRRRQALRRPTPDTLVTSRKRAVAVVAKEHVALVGEIRHDDIGTAIVVEVGKIDAHPGEGLAVLVEADAGQQARLQ